MSATLRQIAGAALSSYETLEATYDLSEKCVERAVQGDFVECGTFAGAQAAAMAKAIMKREDNTLRRANGGPRRVHLFDSFAGIPQAGQHDTDFLEAAHPAGLSACSRAQVEDYMRQWGIDARLLVYHEGPFEQTMKNHGIERIALLRLDGDLYESTRVCLEALYPLVVPGGWAICDDFKLAGARKAVLEYVSPGPIYWRKE